MATLKEVTDAFVRGEKVFHLHTNNWYIIESVTRYNRVALLNRGLEVSGEDILTKDEYDKIHRFENGEVWGIKGTDNVLVFSHVCHTSRRCTFYSLLNKTIQYFHERSSAPFFKIADSLDEYYDKKKSDMFTYEEVYRACQIACSKAYDSYSRLVGDALLSPNNWDVIPKQSVNLMKQEKEKNKILNSKIAPERIAPEKV